MDLHTIWFALIGILLTGYAILDGFDLGVGIMHLIVAKNDKERRVLMNAIGPLWDGNEVWLVTFGGALFAAFPVVYGSVFAGLYTALMLLLFFLIGRAVSMEFRSKVESRRWRTAWDVAFSLSSALISLLFGLAVGNAMLGLPMGADHVIDAGALGIMGLLRPFPVLVGLFVVALFAMHGTMYLYLKTEGELQQRIHKWRWRTFFVFLALFIVVSADAVLTIPNATRNLMRMGPFMATLAWGVVVLNILAIANIPRTIYRGKPLFGFITSSCTIIAFNFLFAMALFPNLVVSSTDEAYNLDIWTAASSEKTLTIMFIFACIGMPFVLAYTTFIYWSFRGKVQMGKMSY